MVVNWLTWASRQWGLHHIYLHWCRVITSVQDFTGIGFYNFALQKVHSRSACCLSSHIKMYKMLTCKKSMLTCCMLSFFTEVSFISLSPSYSSACHGNWCMMRRPGYDNVISFKHWWSNFTSVLISIALHGLTAPEQLNKQNAALLKCSARFDTFYLNRSHLASSIEFHREADWLAIATVNQLLAGADLPRDFIVSRVFLPEVTTR